MIESIFGLLTLALLFGALVLCARNAQNRLPVRLLENTTEKEQIQPEQKISRSNPVNGAEPAPLQAGKTDAPHNKTIDDLDVVSDQRSERIERMMKMSKKSARHIPASSKKYLVHLAVVDDLSFAKKKFESLQDRYPGTLRQHQLMIDKVRKNIPRRHYNFGIGPLKSKSKAAQVCRQLKGIGLKESKIQPVSSDQTQYYAL